MERYFLFCFDGYYPSGGWSDFVGDFPTIEDAQKAAIRDNAQIVDTWGAKRIVVNGTFSERRKTYDWTECTEE